MNEWLIRQGVEQPQTALVIGLLVGLLVGVFTAVVAAWVAARRGARAQQQAIVLETRLADREQQVSDGARSRYCVRSHLVWLRRPCAHPRSRHENPE